MYITYPNNKKNEISEVKRRDFTNNIFNKLTII